MNPARPPKFVLFARRLTLASGLAAPFAGLGGCDAATSGSGKPDAAQIADAAEAKGSGGASGAGGSGGSGETSPDVADETAAADADADDEKMPPYDRPFLGIRILPDVGPSDVDAFPTPGVAVAPHDAASDSDGPLFTGIRTAPTNAAEPADAVDGLVKVPVGGPLSPPEFPA